MERLAPNEIKSLLKAVKTLFSFEQPDTFVSIAEAVKQIIPSDCISLEGIGFNRDQENFEVLHIDPSDAMDRDDLIILPSLISSHPLWPDVVSKNVSTPKKISDKMTVRQFQETPIHVEVYSHYAFSDMITMGAHLSFERMLLVTLSRITSTFIDRDRRLLDALKTFLLTALRHADALERMQGKLNLLEYMLGVENKPLIQFSKGLTNLKMSESAHRLLKKYFFDWSSFLSVLPEKLLQWIRQEEERVEAIDEVNIPPQPFRVVSESSSLTMNLLIDVQNNERALTIEEVYECSFPDLLQSFGLTRRETEILSWVSKGKTNIEIAMICDISHRTVQKHLEHIFQKMGVETRMAASRLALDAISAFIK